jgi:hypothetical protein
MREPNIPMTRRTFVRASLILASIGCGSSTLSCAEDDAHDDEGQGTDASGGSETTQEGSTSNGTSSDTAGTESGMTSGGNTGTTGGTHTETGSGATTGSGSGTTESGSTTGGAVCEDGASATEISNNHGHDLTVPADDIQAGVEQIYDIQGTADHSHTVTLKPPNFAALRQGSPIAVFSDGGDHPHGMTLSCV